MTNHPNRSKTVTVENLAGECERISLPAAHYEAYVRGQSDCGTGVWITGLFVGPRTGRRFVRTHSIWASSKNDGSNVGTRIREIEESEYLRMCERAGCEPVNTEVTEV